jgi:hypothetical protein
MSVATSTPEVSGIDISRDRSSGGLEAQFAAMWALAASLWAQLWNFCHGLAAGFVNKRIDRTKSASHNIVGAAVTLGLSVIMLILMAIVAGYFVAEAPSNGAFSSALDQIESVGGTAFILLAVALLGVPVVAIVGYFMRSGLGGFISTGGMGRRR